MDGFGGYKTAATSALPDAVTVMDPFHVVALAETKLDLCRQRIQQHTCGHRGRTGDPLYRVRRTLRTRSALLTTAQQARLAAVFTADAHIAVEVTWRVYQQIIDAYAHPDPRTGKTLLTTVIDMLRTGVPAGLEATRPTRTHPAPAARRCPDLLHPPGIQRTHRSHQRPPRSPPLKHTRLPQFDQLPDPLPTALRKPRTLIPEEPLK
jgi:hypothetical protein